MQPEMFTTEKSAQVVIVTPDLAANWLKFNTINRRLSDINRERLGTAMESGTFQFNGDAIRWTTDARLADGQHRLEECVRTGVTFETVVVWGIAPGARITIDRNKRRTLRDHLEIIGEAHTKELPTVLNLAAQWARGSRFTIGHQSGALLPSYEDAVEFLRENPNIRTSVAFGATSQARKIMNPAHLGFLHWVLSEVDADDADDFLSRVVTGDHKSASDPSWRLRERLETLRGEHADRPWVVIPLACKAWNLYRDGEPVRYLRIRSGGSAPESFPEPK